MNLKLVDILKSWDPFNLGKDFYDTKIADVIQFVHRLDEDEPLALEIQRIYAHSFEQIIPLNDCQNISKTLLYTKEQQTCEW